jgi:uncharacterized protein involved in outer membrane biogenesis
MALVILLAVFVNSLFLLPAVILLWVWNKEKPILKRDKQG